MRISHDALVLVADGRKSLFLRNEGDDEFLNLVVEDQRAHADLADRDMKSDAPGRSFSSTDARRRRRPPSSPPGCRRADRT